MVQKFEITGVRFDIDADLRSYIIKKLGNIDHYIPRHSRISAHLEVVLRKSKINRQQQAICEVTLYMPHETINLKESAVNIYTAVDLVKTKLQQRIQKYKDEFMNGKQHRHLIGRSRNRLPSRLSGL
ncbi:MAG: ribosome hibernation-promoting factor, HPF/YfiA family [Candidatus Saccharimonadales bacterium]